MRSALRRFRRCALSAAAGTAVAAIVLTGCSGEGQAASDGPTDEASQEESGAPEDGEGEGEGEGEEEEPAEQVVFDYGDESDDVRELQARLAQLEHFAAQPTGYYGDVTLGAVSEYQRASGIEVSGTVFEGTWEALTSETEEPSQEELFPPEPVFDYGDNSDEVRELQARLRQLDHFDENPTGYYGDVTTAAVTAYQNASGIEATGTVFQPMWDALRAETETPTQEEMFPPVEVPDVAPAQDLDERCLEGRVLCISKTSRTLSWVIDGEVQMTVDVRFGAEETPTREGEFEVYWKSRNHHSTLYDSPMPYAMFFDGGQAVHFSQDFAANGYNGASHGCVNVRDEAAIAQLFDEVNEGDRVIVYW
ncbi:peptidoglycan-binding protein [Streptomyces sp. DSM 44917]|uniref:Peptidoglycan-binding protein n=1 Tax=Streptomyces boetiae TaxID=3075541 RepID=A0ABU2L6R9_9ACTN|nr:peptidoglycan-binding protein [Streptomyces sp. DSM 44917]MDT0307136.1 peptidoglycan-binding protein [Streptomyces sp. DSM 44917]